MDELKAQLEALFEEKPALRELYRLNWIEEGLASTEQDLQDALDSFLDMDPEDYEEMIAFRIPISPKR